MTKLAEIVISDVQAGLLAAAADTAIRADEEDQLVSLEDDEREALKQLAVFLAAVHHEPERFPVVGRMMPKLKRAFRQGEGEAQRPARKNKRKERQERRIRFHKARRKERRETAEAYNAAREVMEQEALEAEQYAEEMRARLEAEPKFDVTDAMGNVILAGVPQSMVRPVEGLTLEQAIQQGKPAEIVMPGSAEALETLERPRP